MPLRRLLGPLAAVWLVFQLSVLVGGPVALAASVGDEEPECTCTHGDHAMCPMHHRSSGLPAGWCAIGCDDGDAALLASVTGGLGVLQLAPRVVDPPSASPLQPAVLATAFTRPSPPEPPPPRV